MLQKKAYYLVILAILTFILFIVVLTLVPSIPQWNSYHQFSDVRAVAGIPNFANVISNLPFILVSILGFMALWQKWQNKNLTGKEAIVFLTYFFGVFLTGIGSAYYHWLPNNNTLVWDRLPITIVFMSLLSLTVMERVDLKLGFWLLAPLVIFGIFSVLYWHWTELLGRGDLRLYGIAQFYTIFLLILVLLCFPKSYPPLKIYIGMFICYGLAKLFEQFDLTIYKLLGEWVSGHTLKHIFAAIGAYGVVVMLKVKFANNCMR